MLTPGYEIRYVCYLRTLIIAKDLGGGWFVNQIVTYVWGNSFKRRYIYIYIYISCGVTPQFVGVCMYVYMSVYVCVYVCMFVCLCVCMCVCI